MQPASAATVTCAAIEATSIAMGIPPAFAGSCGAINPGDRFEISYIRSLDPTKFYSLEVANINNLTTNSQIFQNVQFLVSGIIHGNPITDGVITIWPTNDINNSGVPYLQQGVTDYITNATSNTFPPITGIPVSTQASFILTTPQTDIGLGTAGLIITKPLQLSSVGVSSFTGFKIQGEIIRGAVALFLQELVFSTPLRVMRYLTRFSATLTPSQPLLPCPCWASAPPWAGAAACAAASMQPRIDLATAGPPY